MYLVLGLNVCCGPFVASVHYYANGIVCVCVCEREREREREREDTIPVVVELKLHSNLVAISDGFVLSPTTSPIQQKEGLPTLQHHRMRI